MTHEDTVWKIVKEAAILEVTVRELAAALREAENAAYERAIRAVEVMGSGWMNDDQESGWRAAEEAAIAAIRALKDKGE